MAKLSWNTAVSKLAYVVLVGMCSCIALLFRILVVQDMNTRTRTDIAPSPVVVLDVIYKRNYRYPLLITDRQSPVDVVIRSVYFDSRTRDGHKNSTVFLLDVHSDILKHDLITGCGMGSLRADSYKIRDCLLNIWLRKSGVFKEKRLSHWCVMLDCFDLPATPVSKAYIYYKHTSVQPVQRGHWESTTHLNQRTIPVESSGYIVFPSLLKPVKRRTDYPFSITVCRGPVFGTPPSITDWIHYQRTIGVDHIYLVVEKSFVYNGGLDTPEVSKALKDGYLSYTVWENPTDDVRSYYHSQLLAMEDCLYRLMGVSDYVFPVDTDDFFTPVSPQKLLHYYVDKYCHKNGTCGALNMRWIQRHLECGLKERVPLDGNITSVLGSKVKHILDSDKKVNYKTVHRTSLVTDVQVHKHGIILPGFDHVLLPMSEAYVSHVREHTVNEGTRCARSRGERNSSVRCVC